MIKRLVLCLLLSLCALDMYGQNASGNITTSTPGAGQCVSLTVNRNATSTVYVDVSGTWSGTLQPTILLSGGTARNVQVTPTNSQTAQSTITADNGYWGSSAGVDTFQVCATAFASGTAVVTLVATPGLAASLLKSGSGATSVTSITGDGAFYTNSASTGAVTLTLGNAAAHTFWGNNTGTTATPGYESIGTGDLPASVLLSGGALGTPSSGTLTNATGLPISTGVSGLGTGVATFLGTPSSANLLSAMTTSTGSGNVVFATSPTLVTPALGTPSSATLTNATGLGTSGITPNMYAADTGAVNVYAVALSPAMAAYTTGVIGCFKAANANTTNNPTVNFNGLGAKTIVKLNNVVLAGGDIGTVEPVCVIYDGANFDLMTPQNSSGTGGFALIAAPTFLTSITTPLIKTTTKCAAVGSAANPSVAACTAAPAGVFSCSTSSVGNCQVTTTAMISANSTVIVTQDASTTTGTLLGVTCNTTPSAVVPSVITAKVATTSFSFSVTTPVTNPDCFQYLIVN